jgi:hypothetical protein
MPRRQVILLSIATLSACGGSTEKAAAPDAGPPPSFSCKVTDTSGLHTCTDWHVTSGGSVPATVQQQCTGQTVVESCDHSKYCSGGCLLSQTMDGQPVTSILWYFYDSPSDIMASCTEAKGTYIAP